MKHLLSLLTFCLLCSGLAAQNFNLIGQKHKTQQSPVIDKSVRNYSIQEMNVSELFDFLGQHNSNLELNLRLSDASNMPLSLHQVQLVSADYQVLVAEEGGPIKSMEQPTIYNLRGFVADKKGSVVAMTVAKDFLYVFVEVDGESWFIEPADAFDKNIGQNQYLVYEGRQVLDQPAIRCGTQELESTKPLEQSVQDGSPEVDACSKLVEIAVASDYSMVVRYGNLGGVLSHNLALLNASEVNYSSSFSTVVLFSIVSQFVSNCSTCDPWTSSSDRDMVFNSFMNWANAGGFGPGVTYDLGHFRTTRDIFNPSGNQLAGATGLGQICKSGRYSIFSEISTLTTSQLRETTSHEIGHSFGANHSSTGIMAPTVSTSNTWASVSVTEINTGIASATCINTSTCSATPPTGPGALRYLCNGLESCYNFNSNPCNQTYTVTTNDPNLIITVDGTTICMHSLTPGPRTSTVNVTATNFCGVTATESATWNIQIDPILYCNQGRPAATIAGTSDYFQFALEPETLTLIDNAFEPRTKLVQVYDMGGKMLVEQTCDSDLSTISLEGLPSGILIARAIHGKEVLTSKIFHQ